MWCLSSALTSDWIQEYNKLFIMYNDMRGYKYNTIHFRYQSAKLFPYIFRTHV